MSINKIVLIYLTVLNCFFYNKIRAQELKGIYNLHAETYNKVLLNSGGENFIKFQGNKFLLFNLKPNELPISDTLHDEVFQVGMGTYTFTGRKLILNFYNDSNLINHAIKDSISASFSSMDNTSITIKLKSKISVPHVSSGFIVVETPHKKYGYNLDEAKDSIIIKIPSTVIINSITLSILGFDKRILPYDYHFNQFNYYYEVRDVRSLSAIIENQTLEFDISSIKDGIYKFGRLSYLKKCDKNQLGYLKNIQNKNVRIKEIFEKMEFE